MHSFQNVQELHAKCAGASFKICKSFIEDAKELRQSKCARAFFIQDVQELLHAKCARAFSIEHVQELAYHWAHSPSTKIARDHHHGCARTSSWWKLFKPLLQVPPSLEHRQTHTEQEARNPTGGEGGNTATAHTRCIQDPCESIKVLLAPPHPATSPPASLNSICRNRSPIVNYCVGPGRHPAFVAARNAEVVELAENNRALFALFCANSRNCKKECSLAGTPRFLRRL
jgi:hypothetical protein